MTATAHIYPQALEAIGNKTINLADTASNAFLAGLCTGSAATWGATQEAYQHVSDFIGAYTEVTSGGYARVDISSGVTLTTSGNVTTWNCTSPIVFGTSITLSAQCMFIYTTQVGSGDSTYPLIAVADFGLTVSSSNGLWEYIVSGSGLASWTAV